MSEVELHITQVDLSGLMLVLGEHLYSTPTVALRELVQNAHDSIVRRRIEGGYQGGRIDVEVAPGTLTVRDTGSGLTRDEVIRFLATVGAGYTRNLRHATNSDSLIGYFGLGFLSAFVVADEVTVTTTSASCPDETWIYRSRDGERYSLTRAEGVYAVGTEVRLAVKPKLAALASHDAMEELLTRYAALLPIEVHLGTTHINAEPPPWQVLHEDPVRMLHRRLAFARRFEDRFEPICAFDLSAPNLGLVGLLWVQDGATYASSDNRNLSVFVRGMLLDEDCRDLLPTWAGFIGGVVASTKLTPVASREDLQRDSNFDAVQAHIRDVLVEALAALPRRSPEAWRRVRARHGEALLGAAVSDPRLFAALQSELKVPTSEGDLPAALLRSPQGRIHVSLAANGGFEEMLFRALKQPIAVGTRYGVVPFLRRWVEVNGGTIVELGTEAGNRHVFRAAAVTDAQLATLSRCLGGSDRRIAPARFAPPSLPLVLVPDRDAELKRRVEDDEADKRISTAALGLARLFTASITRTTPMTLYVNLDNPAIQALVAADPPADHGAAVLLRGMVALLAGGGEDRTTTDLGPTLVDLGTLACRLLEA